MVGVLMNFLAAMFLIVLGVAVALGYCGWTMIRATRPALRRYNTATSQRKRPWTSSN